MGPRGQTGALTAQRRRGSPLRARAFSPGERHSQEQRSCERQPEREAALPTLTHGS